MCLATLTEPQQPSLCKRNFWECEIYRRSSYSPKVILLERNALIKYERMKNRYLEYLRKLEELFMCSKLEPQVFSTLREKYEKELDTCLRLLRCSEAHD
jgi:hypothetical protein